MGEKEKVEMGETEVGRKRRVRVRRGEGSWRGGWKVKVGGMEDLEVVWLMLHSRHEDYSCGNVPTCVLDAFLAASINT